MEASVLKSDGRERVLDRDAVHGLALAAGFAEAGVVALPHAAEARDAARFEEWVRAGRAGSMQYLERIEERREKQSGERTKERDGERGGSNADGGGRRLIRSRASIPFPWARSAIVCFANYHSAQPRSIDAAAEDTGWIARYAWSSRKHADGVSRPSDYHKVLKKRLQSVEARLHERYGDFEARGYVDTGPVVERALATAAGLGWTGKNTCLIHPRLGSYGFLAVLLTSLQMQPEAGALTVPDRCGSCTRCLDACPTGALIAPYQMDAARCISYLTIEHRGEVDASLMKGMGRQVFGCDICQDVCPWNRKAPIGADAELEPRRELVNPPLEWLAQLDESQFEDLFTGSPVRRTGYQGLRRNVAIAMGNSGVARFAPLLGKWLDAADEGLSSAARWALKQFESDETSPPGAT